MDRMRFNERSLGLITGTLVDDTGAPIPLASLNTATLTLYDLDTYVPNESPVVGIINSRNVQNVLNANDVDIATSTGVFTWVVQPEDNIIVTTRRQMERHKAQFVFAWDEGQIEYECEIEVVNLRKGA